MVQVPVMLVQSHLASRGRLEYDFLWQLWFYCYLLDL